MTTTETSRYRGYDIVPRREWSQWCVSVYPTRSDLPILSRSTLRSLTPRKEDALADARKRIDRILTHTDFLLHRPNEIRGPLAPGAMLTSKCSSMERCSPCMARISTAIRIGGARLILQEAEKRGGPLVRTPSTQRQDNQGDPEYSGQVNQGPPGQRNPEVRAP